MKVQSGIPYFWHHNSLPSLCELEAQNNRLRRVQRVKNELLFKKLNQQGKRKEKSDHLFNNLLKSLAESYTYMYGGSRFLKTMLAVIESQIIITQRRLAAEVTWCIAVISSISPLLVQSNPMKGHCSITGTCMYNPEKWTFKLFEMGDYWGIIYFNLCVHFFLQIRFHLACTASAKGKGKWGGGGGGGWRRGEKAEEGDWGGGKGREHLQSKPT